MSRAFVWSLAVGGVILLAVGFWLLTESQAHAADQPPQPDASREVLVLLRMPAEHFTPDSAYGGSYAAERDAGRGAALPRRAPKPTA
ncbi:MAG: hypothetical protein WDN06_07065 [Asticcacaulis sp.]